VSHRCHAFILCLPEHLDSYAEENRLFSIFSPILRMSIKYDVVYFRNICVAKLERLCPIIVADLSSRPLLSASFDDFTDDMINAFLALGQNSPGLRFILPFVYLWLAPTNSADKARWQRLSTPYASADGKLYSVDSDSILVCLRGSLALSERHNVVIQAVFAPAASCTSKEACGQVLGKRRTTLVTHNRFWRAIWEWKKLDESESLPSLVCDNCYSLIGQAWTLERSKTWNLFPGFFGLPGWEELNKC
jgi:hypothetical protein